MGRESSSKSNYEIISIVTCNKERVIGGTQLSLYASTEEEQKTIAIDIAKATKADVSRMSNGDYLILKVLG
ncbi:MAG: capping complex subunit for YIEGIA [Paraclostridium sp.]